MIHPLKLSLIAFTLAAFPSWAATDGLSSNGISSMESMCGKLHRPVMDWSTLFYGDVVGLEGRVELWLDRGSDKASGLFLAPKNGMSLVIDGSVSDQGDVVFCSWDFLSGRFTGHFTGRLTGDQVSMAFFPSAEMGQALAPKLKTVDLPISQGFPGLNVAYQDKMEETYQKPTGGKGCTWVVQSPRFGDASIGPRTDTINHLIDSKLSDARLKASKVENCHVPEETTRIKRLSRGFVGQRFVSLHDVSLESQAKSNSRVTLNALNVPTHQPNRRLGVSDLFVRGGWNAIWEKTLDRLPLSSNISAKTLHQKDAVVFVARHGIVILSTKASSNETWEVPIPWALAAQYMDPDWFP